MNKYITKEGAEELEKQDNRFHNVILAYATLLANKDGTILVNEVHIKNASKRVFIFEHIDVSKIKWFIAITLAVLLSLAIFQISAVIYSPQLHLWLLPICTIVWVAVLSYIFRDFL